MNNELIMIITIIIVIIIIIISSSSSIIVKAGCSTIASESVCSPSRLGPVLVLCVSFKRNDISKRCQ